MAAKAKAATKATAKTVTKKATVAKAKGKGLTAAQYTAYNKAYGATYTAARNKAALRAMAQKNRKYQLAYARQAIAQYNSARLLAQKAAIAAYAARTSFMRGQLAHQNRALLNRLQYRANTAAATATRALTAQNGSLQRPKSGARAFMNSSVMATLTSAQALAQETSYWAHQSKAYKKAKGTAKPGTLLSKAQTAKIQHAAQAAGNAAAKAVKPGKTATASKAKKTAKAGPGTVKKVAKASAAKHAAGAQSKKAPVVKPKPRAAKPPWAGDEETPNCVVMAIVNHLKRSIGITAPDRLIDELTDALHPEPTIEEALWQVWMMAWPTGIRARMKSYRAATIEEDYKPGSSLIVGYDTEYGPHAALLVSKNRVVSWGSVMDLPAPVEEAWAITWET